MKRPRGFQKRGRLLVGMAILISASVSACGQGAAVSSAGTPSPTALASPITSPTPSLVAQLPSPCSLLTAAQVASAIATPTVNGMQAMTGLTWMGGIRCLWRGRGVAQCIGGAYILEDDLKLESSIEAAQSDFQTVVLAAGKAFGCSPSPLAGLGDEAETCTPTPSKDLTLPQIVLLARKANVLVACALVTPNASGILNRALTAAQVIADGV
jgi:hypothetical protein